MWRKFSFPVALFSCGSVERVSMTIVLSVCDTCRRSASDPLFLALERLAKDQDSPCTTCGAAKQTYLFFDSGPYAGKVSTVVAAFLPRAPCTWKDSEGREVTRCSFLVVTARGDDDCSVWMPYWNVTAWGNRRSGRPGQLQAHFDLASYADLVDQATAAGLLKLRRTRLD
jgi:hypothetical protein